MSAIKKADGTFAYTDSDKADAFNSFFASVFIPDGNRRLFSLQDTAPRAVISSITFDITQVYFSLSRLKPSMVSGPDGIPSIYVKTFAAELAEPLFHIYQFSLEQGIIYTPAF